MEIGFELARIEGEDAFAGLCERTNARAIRIKRAVSEAGFDPEMLDSLPASYVAAALILGVKD